MSLLALAEPRILEKIHTEPMSGCWIWSGALSIGGYAKAGFMGVTLYVHRVLYQRAKAVRLRKRQYLDHKCRLRCCVNWDHLRVVTPRQNAVENSLSPAATHARKTACGVCGGSYGQRKDRRARYCRDCSAQQSAAYRLKNLDRLRAYDRARNKKGRR